MEEAAALAELRLHHPAPGARPHGEVEEVAGVAVHPPTRPLQGRGLVPATHTSLDTSASKRSIRRFVKAPGEGPY